MMQNTKTVIASLIVALVVSIGYFGYSFMNKDGNADEVKVTDQTKASDGVEIVIGNIPTLEEVAVEFPLDLTELEIQNYIHWMSHQKIQAKQKWGKMLITKERIDRLLEVVEKNEFIHEDLYKDILTRWSEEDFTQAVKDHNAIWSLQNGSVGKAKRLLNEEEEQEYIKNYLQ
jgi:hypothetical protein